MARITMESLMAPGGILDASGRLVQTLFTAPIERKRIEEDIRRHDTGLRVDALRTMAGAKYSQASELEKQLADEAEEAARIAAARAKAGGDITESDNLMLRESDEFTKTLNEEMQRAGQDAKSWALYAQTTGLKLPAGEVTLPVMHDAVAKRMRAQIATFELGKTGKPATPENVAAWDQEFGARMAKAQEIRARAQANAAASAPAPDPINGLDPSKIRFTGVDADERRATAERLRAQADDYLREWARIVGVTYSNAQSKSLSAGPLRLPSDVQNLQSKPMSADMRLPGSPMDTAPVAPGTQAQAPTALEPQRFKPLGPALETVTTNPPGTPGDPRNPVGNKADATALAAGDNEVFDRQAVAAIKAFRPFSARTAKADGKVTKEHGAALRDAFQDIVGLRLLEHKVSPEGADRFVAKIRATDALRLMPEFELLYDTFQIPGGMATPEMADLLRARAGRALVDQFIAQLNAGTDRVPPHRPAVAEPIPPEPDGTQLTMPTDEIQRRVQSLLVPQAQTGVQVPLHMMKREMAP
jgi:hypothetical protein